MEREGADAFIRIRAGPSNTCPGIGGMSRQHGYDRRKHHRANRQCDHSLGKNAAGRSLFDLRHQTFPLFRRSLRHGVTGRKLRDRRIRHVSKTAGKCMKV
jgi:hypothetical protein